MRESLREVNMTGETGDSKCPTVVRNRAKGRSAQDARGKRNIKCTVSETTGHIQLAGWLAGHVSRQAQDGRKPNIDDNPHLHPLPSAILAFIINVLLNRPGLNASQVGGG